LTNATLPDIEVIISGHFKKSTTDLDRLLKRMMKNVLQKFASAAF
jgi:hypothetical protein